MTRKSLLVVEDGEEYAEFARLFLSEEFDVRGTRTAGAAIAAVRDAMPDALLLDLRFDRTPAADLLGDVPELASRLFGGDHARAQRYVQDQQGALILAALRELGCHAPAVFVHDFPARRLDNLRRLYGRVAAVPSFDAAAIREALGSP